VVVSSLNDWFVPLESGWRLEGDRDANPIIVVRDIFRTATLPAGMELLTSIISSVAGRRAEGVVAAADEDDTARTFEL
jgi:hypothetical protein